MSGASFSLVNVSNRPNVMGDAHAECVSRFLYNL